MLVYIFYRTDQWNTRSSERFGLYRHKQGSKHQETYEVGR